MATLAKSNAGSRGYLPRSHGKNHVADRTVSRAQTHPSAAPKADEGKKGSWEVYFMYALFVFGLVIMSVLVWGIMGA